MLGMYLIPIFQIRPEPDLAGFINLNPARAGAELRIKVKQHQSQNESNESIQMIDPN